MDWLLTAATATAAALEPAVAYAANVVGEVAQSEFVPQPNRDQPLPESLNTLIGTILFWIMVFGYAAGGAAMAWAAGSLALGYKIAQGKGQAEAKQMLIYGLLGLLILGVVPNIVNELADFGR